MPVTKGRAALLNQSDRPTASHYTILAMSWAGWLFDFYDLMLFSFLLVPIRQDLGLSDAQLSLLLGASLAATALGGLAFGWLADRLGRKVVLSFTILTYSLGTFLCGLSPNMGALLVFRIVTGLGVGGEWATGQTLVGETFPARMRARFAAVMQTGAPAGIALAAVVGGFVEPALAGRLGPSWGWRACFFVSTLPALLVVAVRRYMPESDVWEEWQRHPERREAASGQHFLASLRRDAPIRRLFLLGLVLAVTDMSAYWFTYSWMPKYLYDKLHFSMNKAGIWMLVTQAGGLLGYLSFGIVADWKGRRVAYTLYSLIWAAGLLSVTWFWGTLVTVPALTLVFLFLVGVGTGNFSGYGPIFSELFPTRIRNTAMGTAFNLARGVQFFTPLVITWVASMTWLGPERSLGMGISIGAFFALLTGAWVWTLPETRGTRILAAGLARGEEPSFPRAPA
ncbi:MAG: MFS transporter [Acidobacteriia bacterium]|nr:MFS transporter [Terriglobia bacterium]